MTPPTQGEDRRIPVIVLGGFLGSGKTTLLNRLLGSKAWSRSAVVINEFGAVSLDHLLVQNVAGDRVVLKNGCVCCTIRTDLQSALRALLDDPEIGNGARFERILIETTGLADPGPVAQTLVTDPMLRQQTRLAAIACTVDAVHGRHQIATYDECLNQIAAADHLLITKGDIAEAAAVTALSDHLSALNPIAAIVDVAAAPDALEAIVDEARQPGPAGRGATSFRLSCAPVHPRRDLASPHARVSSITIESEASLDWTAFAVWLSAFVHAHADRVMRIKGILFVKDRAGPIALHVVRNHIHPPVHLDATDDMPRVSRIVFIVREIDTGVLKRSLFEFIAPAPTNAVAPAPLPSANPAHEAHPERLQRTPELLGRTLS